MTLRTRTILAIIVSSLLPLALLAIGVRIELGRQFAASDRARDTTRRQQVTASVDAWRGMLRRDAAAFAARLESDSRFRAWVLEGDSMPPAWLRAMAAELTNRVLLIQSERGMVVSSSRFPAEYGLMRPAPPPTDSLLLLRYRTPQQARMAIAITRPFTVAAHRFLLTLGDDLDDALIAQMVGNGSLEASVTLPGQQSTFRGTDPVASLPLRFVDRVDSAPAGTATIMVTGPESPSRALLHALDRWLVIAGIGGMLIAIAIAIWLASLATRSIRQLTDRVRDVTPEQLQLAEESSDDEVGTLTSAMRALLTRVQESNSRLRAADRRVATGDLARQVNHDIRNGLAPLRHSLRHLGEVADTNPAALAHTFQERRGMLETSLEYLDGLARTYAQLAPPVTGGTADAVAIVQAVVGDVGDQRVRINNAGAARLLVRGDPVALRRILENLVRNAVESLESPTDTVTVGVDRIDGAEGAAARLSVADTGRGMGARELDAAFEHFHTTRADGTGLGLPVVRRLVADLGGSLRVRSAPGEGTVFELDFPLASEA